MFKLFCTHRVGIMKKKYVPVVLLIRATKNSKEKQVKKDRNILTSSYFARNRQIGSFVKRSDCIA